MAAPKASGESEPAPPKPSPPMLTPGKPPLCGGLSQYDEVVMYVSLKILGGAVAYALYRSADEAATQAKLDNLQSSGLYVFVAACVLFKWLNDFAVLNQFGYRVRSGVDLPNMHAYSTLSGETVLLHVGGDELGAFNRAGRAQQNFHEYAAITLALLAATSFVFPIYAAWLLAAFVVGRFFYVCGYTMGTKARIPGYFLSNFIAIQGLESFATVITCVLVKRVGISRVFFG